MSIDDTIDERIYFRNNDYFTINVKIMLFIAKYAGKTNLTKAHIMLYTLSQVIKSLVEKEYFGRELEEAAETLNEYDDVAIDKFNKKYCEDCEMERMRPKANKIAFMSKARAERTYERFLDRIIRDNYSIKWEIAMRLNIPRIILDYQEEL